MAEYDVAPGVKFSNVDKGSLAEGMINREISMVYLWDCGPSKPVAPKRPETPKGKEGDPEYDLAKVEFKVALDQYQEDLASYGRRKEEFRDFDRRYGGPFEVKMWSVDARDALARDGEAVANGKQDRQRWYLSARTRGYESLPNHGLPGNMKPGHGHAENLRREREGEDDLAAVKKSDPIFGQLEHV